MYVARGRVAKWVCQRPELQKVRCRSIHCWPNSCFAGKRRPPIRHQATGVFASCRLKGRQPRVGNMLVEDYLRPAAAKAGILSSHRDDCGRLVEDDPRRFGYMKIIARKALDDEPLLKGLGPEPLGNEFDAKMLARSCANKKTSLKAALLDQRVVAGLGNIYVCEALFRSQLSPRRLAATLADKKGQPTDHARRLVDAIHAVLNQAIRAGGSSLRDHRQTSGELGYFQHSFQVYDREGEKCQTAGCSGVVRRFTQNGRSTFWCPKCQK